MQNESDKLINEHWEYVKHLLLIHGEKSETIDKIEFHYITALKHGIKHGVEIAKKFRERENK